MQARIRRLGVLVLVMVLAMVVIACTEKPGATGGQITIGVGGQPLLVYLPTTLAQQLGHYEQDGAPPRFRTPDPIRSGPEQRGINAGTAQEVHA